VLVKGEVEPASSVTAKVFVDCSDLLYYLVHHSVVSGIQRVVAETIPGLLAGGQVELVAFDHVARHFVLVEKDDFLALLRIAQHSTRAEQSLIAPAAEAIQKDLPNRPAVRGRSGDSLMILGASWIYEGLYQAVMQLKDAGVAVVVLLYDIIPAVLGGYPEHVIQTFRHHLPRIAFLADRVPTISGYTRVDFERYCSDRGWPCPPGQVTRLSADQWQGGEQGRSVQADRGWPRPFVLMVSTVEGRKNHLLALRCWQALIRRFGPEAVPDLVCVGRLGWNVSEFFEEYTASNGLEGKMTLLMDHVPDERLAALYRDCLFTVYPSRYEGWGLPITESLMQGKAVVTADNTSLPEAGGEYALYFEDNHLPSFVDQVATLLDAPTRTSLEATIRSGYSAPSWDDVAAVLIEEARLASAAAKPFVPQLEMGREYGLGAVPVYSGPPEGVPYRQYLEERRRLPLTGQVMGPFVGFVAEMLVAGTELHPTDGGRPIAEGKPLTLAFPRAIDGASFLVGCLRLEQGAASLRVTGPRGPRDVRLGRGGVFVVDLAAGAAGEDVVLTVESLDGEVTLESVTVVASAEVAHGLAAQRQGWVGGRSAVAPDLQKKLAYMESSLSWRITRPLRESRSFAARVKRRVTK
jgi:glycosyltransferase involved in cell wall biosynthesis